MMTYRSAAAWLSLLLGVPISCYPSVAQEVLVVEGTYTSQYRPSVSPETTIDARNACFLASPDNSYPIDITSGCCLIGGTAEGNYDSEQSWDYYSNVAGPGLRVGLNQQIPFVVDGLRLDNHQDGIRLRANVQDFAIRNVYMTGIHDDCVENDLYHSGVVEDSLLDGCSVAFSAREGSTEARDGTNEVWTIRNSLVRKQAFNGPSAGPSPGHGPTFKLAEKPEQGIPPKLALHDNIFRMDQPASHGPSMFPEGFTRIESCSNNVLVWLGEGDFPGFLGTDPTTGQPCFTVTNDASVWDNAKAAWLARQGAGTAPGPCSMPDLTVVLLAPPSSATAGSPVAVSDTIENRGPEPTGQFLVALYFSTDTTLDVGDAFLGSRTVTGLGWRETSAAVTSVTIPSGTAPGTYYILAWADPDGIVLESSDVNNTRYAAITVGSNLIASSLAVSSPATPGTTIAVTDTVANVGVALPIGTSVSFHLSTDPAFDAGDASLGSRVLPALGASATSSAVTSLTIPPQTAPGVYYVLARVDPDDLIPEFVEIDNLRAAPLTVTVAGDLMINALDTAGTAIVGSSISISDTVKNAGKGPAPGSIVTFWLSANQTYDAADVSLGSRQVPPLASRVSNIGVTQVTIPVGTVPGNYYIIGRIATQDGAPETSVTNNTKASRRLRVQ